MTYIITYGDLAKVSAFKVHQIAATLGYSARQVQRHFRSKFGMSAHCWLTQYRMSVAVKLLSTGAPIKVVAVDVGFVRPENFSREFKRCFSVTPSHARLNEEKLHALEQRGGVVFEQALSLLDRQWALRIAAKLS